MYNQSTVYKRRRVSSRKRSYLSKMSQVMDATTDLPLPSVVMDQLASANPATSAASPRYPTRGTAKGDESPKTMAETNTASSSPLSSVGSPRSPPTNEPESTPSSPSKQKIILRFNTTKTPVQEASPPETLQASLKRKRSEKDETVESAKKSKSTPTTKRTSAKASKARVQSFSEDTVVGVALRDIYDTISEIPQEEVKLKWVPVEKRRHVFDLVQRLVNYWEPTKNRKFTDEVRAIQLDLHLWDAGIRNVCKVRYPFFEKVMEKILLWIDKGTTYKVEKLSLAKHEEAKGVKVVTAANSLIEEEQLRESELNRILSDLKILEEQPHGIFEGDPTLHRLRAGIFNIATRFSIEQSIVDLDCASLINHLRADLHLNIGDLQLMKDGKLKTLSRSDILAISKKIPDWVRGRSIYQPGRRAVYLYNDWYEEYSAIHKKMVDLGLYEEED